MTEWEWNDDAIPDSETIYRHIPVGDESCIVRDGNNRAVQLNKNAFPVEQLRADGWSIFRLLLLHFYRCSVSHIERSATEPDANPRQVWQANLGQLRALRLEDDPELRVGVFDREDTKLGDLGKAHGVIRFNLEKVPKPKIRLFREIMLRLFEQTSS